jgi:uncharacterized protein
MTMTSLDRRHFLGSATAIAFAGLATRACAAEPATKSMNPPRAYGNLIPDPNGLLDLPKGFSYRVISELGQRMDDGWLVADRADGMGAFNMGGGKVALVRNHELAARHVSTGAFNKFPNATVPTFDRRMDGAVVPGGTSTLIYDMKSGRTLQQYQSLAGTIRNCSGGITPWGSWLTCEEDVTRAGMDAKGNGVGQDHGWIFEVPAAAKGLVDPIPLKAMGRFNHEAAAVDPKTGIVYLTEDKEDGLFYRFLPAAKGELSKGGTLQALAFADAKFGNDSRNWADKTAFPIMGTRQTRWITLDNPESPEDDLRKRGAAKGAVAFARGEGVHYGRGKNGQSEFFFVCTSGGAIKYGQIFKYVPGANEGKANMRGESGTVQLFVESTDPKNFNFGDNLTVAPNGHLIVCEDQYTDVVDNHLRGVTPDGRLYDLAKLRSQTELAGACFSPDGSTLFVNAYAPTKTLAITGPWGNFKRG